MYERTRMMVSIYRNHITNEYAHQSRKRKMDCGRTFMPNLKLPGLADPSTGSFYDPPAPPARRWTARWPH